MLPYHVREEQDRDKAGAKGTESGVASLYQERRKQGGT